MFTLIKRFFYSITLRELHQRWSAEGGDENLAIYMYYTIKSIYCFANNNSSVQIVYLYNQQTFQRGVTQTVLYPKIII